MPSVARMQAEQCKGGDKHHEEAARRVGVVNEGLNGTEFGERLFGVEFAQGAEHADAEAGGRQRGAKDELGANGVGLHGGVVDLPAGIAIDILFVDIVDDADDEKIVLGIAFGVAGDDSAEGIVVGPMRERGEVARVGLVDHHDVLTVRSVGPGEVTTAKRCSHRALVARCTDVDERAVNVVRES